MSKAWYMDRDRCAHRGAGQAVAAVLIGAPLARASVEAGAIVSWRDRQHLSARRDRQALALMFVTLMGVAAMQRYSFGVPLGNAIYLLPHSEDKISADDLDQVAMVSLRLQEPAFAAMAVIRQYVSELVLQPDIWNAMEMVANRLVAGALTGEHVARLCSDRIRRPSGSGRPLFGHT